MSFTPRQILLWGALAALLTPAGVFVFVAIFKGLSIADTSRTLLAQLTAARLNLLVCGALGWIPVSLLALFWYLLQRFSASLRKSTAPVIGGLVPVVAVLLWVNLEYWPHFLPSRVPPSYPGGLELILGPGLFAPIGMLFGFLAGWLWARVGNRS